MTSQWVMVLLRDIHYDITMDNDVTGDIHCDIAMGNVTGISIVTSPMANDVNEGYPL